ncbi:MAG TPA: hypothetical protein VLD62_12720 [Acidimicrobiia bacterium]|nr:hypothetical protein [Acidimicrobiia bacterium]
MEISSGKGVLVPGTYVSARIGALFFPFHRIEGDGGAVADLGRYSAFSIYFGRGQRVRLSDGRDWRVTALRHGGGLSPVVADEQGRRVAQAFAGIGNYGLDTADLAYTLDPAVAGRGRSNRWLLTRHDETHALVSRRPHTVIARQQIPMGVGLLAFLLALTGIPGESDLGVPNPYG